MQIKARKAKEPTFPRLGVVHQHPDFVSQGITAYSKATAAEPLLLKDADPTGSRATLPRCPKGLSTQALWVNNSCPADSALYCLNWAQGVRGNGTPTSSCQQLIGG